MPRSYASDLLANDIGLEGGRLTDYSPRSERRKSDLFMVFLAAAATAGVLFNALAMQNGRRDDITSLFSLVQAEKPAPTPPSAPAQIRPAAPAAQPVAELAPPPVEAPPPPMVLAPSVPLPPVKPPAPPPRAPAPVQAQPQIQPPMPLAAAPSPGVSAVQNLAPASVRPPAELGASARVMEVQKALASIGYGPIPIDGRTGTATQQAIQRFERDRRQPVTGEINERLIRELNAVGGFSIR